MSAAAVPFKGIPVTLGGVDYLMPKLSFGGFENSKHRMQQIAEGSFTDPVQLQNAFVDVIHSALLRNYPEMPRQLLVDELDWDTAPEIFQRLMTNSVPSAPPGESRVESQSGASTGKRRSRK